MALSKMEIQQMLREMNVKFHADETYDQLKQRLQQENHSLWLKSIHGEPAMSREARKTLVRKRKRQETTEPICGETPADEKDGSLRRQPASRIAADLAQRPVSKFRPRPIEKPAPGEALEGGRRWNGAVQPQEKGIRIGAQAGPDTAANTAPPLPMPSTWRHIMSCRWSRAANTPSRTSWPCVRPAWRPSETIPIPRSSRNSSARHAPGSMIRCRWSGRKGGAAGSATPAAGGRRVSGFRSCSTPCSSFEVGRSMVLNP
jgi:hypothetical protein